MSKVLLVTDYSGNLHITPIGNKAYYQSVNQKVKDKQFRLKEVDSEEEAKAFVEKNQGKDPEFITPKKAQSLLADKDLALAEKDKAIEDKDNQLAELKAQLAAMQSVKIENNGNNNVGLGDAGKGEKTLAADLIAKITASATVDEVNALIIGEERVTVIKAAQDRIAQLSQQN